MEQVQLLHCHLALHWLCLPLQENKNYFKILMKFSYIYRLKGRSKGPHSNRSIGPLVRHFYLKLKMRLKTMVFQNDLFRIITRLLPTAEKHTVCVLKLRHFLMIKPWNNFPLVTLSASKTTSWTVAFVFFASPYLKNSGLPITKYKYFNPKADLLFLLS